jgi:asparagine synthase (glutamine-hydrolysing)
MCGIAGYLGKNRFDTKNIQNILETLYRRGPDSNGFKEIPDGKDFLSLFSSRLNIIDNDNRANQPFVYKDKYLIFNGEIYNYLELKSELKNKGYNFKTTSDTEVLIKVLDYWEESGIKKLEGMWSFFFFDNTKKKGILCRDRFGEKPLFYYHKNNEFIFGSEIKTINEILNRKLSINLNKIDEFLRYGYRKLYKNNSTYFEEISEFPRGCYFIIRNKKIIKKDYWKIKYKKNDDSEDSSFKKIKEHLFKSIEIRLRSDFPIAFFLSGGIDSNSLAFIAKKYFKHDVNSFSIIGNDKNYDESDYINYASKELGVNHYNLKIDLKKLNFISLLSKQINYHDSPVTTINSFLQFALFKKIKKDGFRVSISGLGADEMFSGYYDHHLLYLNEIKKNKKLFKISFENWKREILPLVRNPLLKNYFNFNKKEILKKHTFQIEKFKENIFIKKKKVDFSENKYVSSLIKNRMINQLRNETVPVVLKEDDLNAMYYSIENRSPFLDSKLFQECLNMPADYYIKNGMAKWPLRKIVSGIVPDKIRLNRRKVGFNAPLENVFDFKDKKNLEFLLEDNQIFDIVDKKILLKVIKKNKNFSSVENIFLFNFISSKIFLQNLS